MPQPWTPQSFVPLDQILDESATMLSSQDRAFTEYEDVFRISEVGLDWDIGVMVYEPAEIALAPSGQQVGVFLLHGGSQDFRSMEGFARLITAKLGYKVVSMTYPGRLYLDSSDRVWPCDTIREDGSVRTPIWLAGESVDRDEYDVIEDLSMRQRYGTRVLAKAKPGTRFHARMAGWPAAFETGMKQACARHLGPEFSVVVHGHSTGGPFVSMLSQRVPNIVGLVAIENSPFGYIQEEARVYTGNAERRAAGKPERTAAEWRRVDPFDELSIRTWREEARYAGPEAAANEGLPALMRLPELMEEVLDTWDRVKIQANFKCEYMVTRNVVASLEAAAIATAERLGLSPDDTAALVARYVGMTRELVGPGAKPVPATLFGITSASRDHPEEVYHDVILPLFAAMNPPATAALTKFGAGVHEYTKPAPELPMGVAPSVITSWQAAVDNGFFE
jgi:hypothetical protein